MRGPHYASPAEHLEFLKWTSAARARIEKAKQQRYRNEVGDVDGKPVQPRDLPGTVLAGTFRKSTRSREHVTLQSSRANSMSKTGTRILETLENARISQPATQKVRVNRKGFFNWNRWKGDVWRVEETAAYQKYSHSEYRRIMENFHNSFRSKPNLPRIIITLWEDYYHASAIAHKSTERLSRLIVDCSITLFLLRTAPPIVSRGLLHIVRSYEVLNMSLVNDLYALERMRRMLALRAQNPLFFKASVQRKQIEQATIAQKIEERMANKISRVRIKDKAQAGYLGAYHNTGQARVSEPRNERSEYEKRLRACPPRWSAESLHASLSILRSRTGANFQDLALWIQYQDPPLRVNLFTSIDIKIKHAKRTFSELGILSEMIMFLRCFRLQQLPQSFTPREIELGRSIWMRSHDAPTGDDNATSSGKGQMSERSALSLPIWEIDTGRCMPNTPFRSTATSESPNNHNHQSPASKTVLTNQSNRRGLVRWELWDGKDLSVDSMRIVKMHAVPRLAAESQAELHALHERVSRATPRQVDRFMMAHLQARYEVAQQLLPIVRLLYTTIVISFLLKTSPAPLWQRITPYCKALTDFSYELGSDLEQLRGIMTTRVHHLNNPLLFSYLANVLMEKGAAISRSLEVAIIQKTRELRSDWKSNYRESGSVPEDWALSFGLKVKRKLQLQMSRHQAAQYAMRTPKIENDIASPFYRVLNMLVAKMRFTTTKLQRCKQIYFRCLSGPAVWQLERDININADRVSHLQGLGYDLVSLRYFRLHVYPDLVTTAEVKRETDFLDRFHKTLNQSLRNERRQDMERTRYKTRSQEVLGVNNRARLSLAKSRDHRTRRGPQQPSSQSRARIIRRTYIDLKPRQDMEIARYKTRSPKVLGVKNGASLGLAMSRNRRKRRGRQRPSSQSRAGINARRMNTDLKRDFGTETPWSRLQERPPQLVSKIRYLGSSPSTPLLSHPDQSKKQTPLIRRVTIDFGANMPQNSADQPLRSQPRPRLDIKDTKSHARSPRPRSSRIKIHYTAVHSKDETQNGLLDAQAEAEALNKWLQLNREPTRTRSTFRRNAHAKRTGNYLNSHEVTGMPE